MNLIKSNSIREIWIENVVYKMADILSQPHCMKVHVYLTPFFTIKIWPSTFLILTHIIHVPRKQMSLGALHLSIISKIFPLISKVYCAFSFVCLVYSKKVWNCYLLSNNYHIRYTVCHFLYFFSFFVGSSVFTSFFYEVLWAHEKYAPFH